MNIIETVDKFVSNGDKIVVAVSGGKDSMSLLFALLQIKKHKDFELSCITVEHGIRGETSKKDAEFVYNYCLSNKIYCKIVSIDVPKLAKLQKKTIEECARDARYEALLENIDSDSKLFVAHHASDQAETILMHILRGSGIDGAIGMQNRDNIVRPLLDVTKNEIDEFVKRNKIAFVEDSTNDDVTYTRNYIRKEIMPRLSQIYPNFEHNILNFASICKEYANIVDGLVKNEWFSAKNGQLCVSGEAFLQNKLVSAKVIKIAYNKCGEFSDLESKHILLATELFEYGKNGSTINFPHGIIVEKRKEGLYFYKNINNSNDEEVFKIGKNSFVNVEIVQPKDVSFGDGNLYVDYDKIPVGAIWRTRRDGDYFEKLGSHGKKKLNDYFTDKKITLKQRDNLLLLANGSEILLVLSLDVSNKLKIDAGTEKIARISFEGN